MGSGLNVLDAERLLKETTSRCPHCLSRVPAAIVEVGGAVLMRKRCPRHGPFELTIARRGEFYHIARGAGENSACCGGGVCGPEAVPGAVTSAFETLSTCIALIEIVDSCNLTCPTCYSESPLSTGHDVEHCPFDQFVARVEGVLRRKGNVDILQLSGGEPTLHPEFFRVLDWSLAEPRIGYVLVNTNAVRIATDEVFRERLGESRRRFGKFELYVQFDGPQAEGQARLRGADLRSVRRKAIDEAGALGVPSTLAMVVSDETIAHIGDALRFGLERAHCRGITFQPMFLSGRLPDGQLTVSGRSIAAGGNGALARRSADAPQPISVGDIVNQLVKQAPELVTADDFTPLPCGDPNCHTIGYLLRTNSGTTGVSRLVDLKTMQGFLRNRVDYRVEDLARCGCESEPLGALIKSLEIGPEQPFRIFIKPFMDAWTYDQDRIDRCCTHVIRPDGKLDSFCRYYLLGGAKGMGLE